MRPLVGLEVLIYRPMTDDHTGESTGLATIMTSTRPTPHRSEGHLVLNLLLTRYIHERRTVVWHMHTVTYWSPNHSQVHWPHAQASLNSFGVYSQYGEFIWITNKSFWGKCKKRHN